MKVKLERSLTIPTAQYSPVRISASLEADIESGGEVESLSKTLDSIMALEAIKVLDEYSTIASMGYERYLKSLKNNYEEILKGLEEK